MLKMLRCGQLKLQPNKQGTNTMTKNDEKEEEVAPTVGKTYSIKTPAAAKVSKADKFDALFEDEEEAGDLPWEK